MQKTMRTLAHEALAKLTPEDRAEVKEAAAKALESFGIQLSDMVDNGEVSSTAAKEILKDPQHMRVFSIYMEA